MKSIFIIIIMILSIFLYSNTLTVKQDGTGDYSIIQMAVENSVTGDTILVYPGTYYENVDLTEKDITLGSLNMIANDFTYISTTIIDGNHTGSCILILDTNNTSVIGFTLQHGSGTITPGSSQAAAGGGLRIKNSTARIKNNVLINNFSWYGGGIATYNSIVNFSGNIIIKNHSILTGGGINLGVNSIVEFNEENLNSIYLNSSCRGNDISIYRSDMNIILDKFTVINPDNFYIANKEGSYTFNCNEEVITPVENDLFVSTGGNDSNSGLTADDALQTITYALILIKADSLHQRTIHIANGIYSQSLTNELFPLNMKSYVSLIGESEENTIIDGENGNYQIMTGYDGEQNVEIKNFTIKNIIYNLAVISFSFNMIADEIIRFSVKLENITIENISPFIRISRKCDETG